MTDLAVVELLRDLIRLPSYVSKDNNENKVVEYIRSWFEANTHLSIEKQKLPGGRFNLILKNGEPRTIFLAHTDTVGVSQNAPFPQLAAEVHDGQIWGRGATDMKSGVAALMVAIARSAKVKNFWACFYADEEYDFLGMKEFVKTYGQIRPKLIVSSDGSDLLVGHGCRGLIEITARVKGETGHPAKGTGKNAIWGSFIALNELTKYLSKYTHPIMGSTTFNLAYLLGGAELPNSLLAKNLDNVGKAGNVVPDICEFTIDIRPAKAGLNSKTIIDQIQKSLQKKQLQMEIVEIKHDLGAWYTDEKDIKNFLQGNNYSDPKKTGYLDLQMFWDRVGRPPAFMFGGGIGSTAHKPDERIKIKDLLATQDFFVKVFKKINI